MVKGRNPRAQIRAIKAKNHSSVRYGTHKPTSKVHGTVRSHGVMMIKQGNKTYIVKGTATERKRKPDNLLKKVTPNQVEAKISPVPGFVDITARWNLKK